MHIINYHRLMQHCETLQSHRIKNYLIQCGKYQQIFKYIYMSSNKYIYMSSNKYNLKNKKKPLCEMSK